MKNLKEITKEDEDQIHMVTVLDKNENGEKILVLYPNQKQFFFGAIGGFLNRFRDGKSNEILYCGRIESFKTDNKEILSAIRGLNGDKENYMLFLEYSNNPKGKLDEIPFKKAKELVKNKEAELKQYLGDMELFLSYRGNLYFRNEFKKAYCW